MTPASRPLHLWLPKLMMGCGAGLVALPQMALAKEAGPQAAAISATPSASSIAEQLRQATQQLAQLQAQIAALQEQVNAAAAKQEQLAKAENAKAETAIVEAKADRALAAAEKAQGALARTEKAIAAVKWAADTSVSGRLYINMSNITQHIAGGPSPNSGVGVNLKRAFVTVEHRFSPTMLAAVTLDADNVFGQPNTQNPAPANTPATSQLVGKGFFIKTAYGEAKLDPKLTVRLGAAQLPWYNFSESMTGFRHIERPLTDRTGFGFATDWGVHALGELYKSPDASIGYAISAINGAGVRQVKIGKSMDFEGRLTGTYKGFYVGVGGYIGKLGNNTQALGNLPSTFHTARRFDALGGYRNALFNLGGEYFYAKNWQDVAVNPALNQLSQDSAQGFALFGNYNLSRQWTAIGRYDWVKPNKITVPGLADNFLVAGLQYSPAKIVDIALVYKRETVNGGAFNTANGVIGCSALPTPHAFGTAAGAYATCTGNGTYDEFGIFTQLRF
jgi:hypothetical protein